jgi:hypothetical protein
MKHMEKLAILAMVGVILAIIWMHNTDQNCMQRCLSDGNLYHYCLKFCSY